MAAEGKNRARALTAERLENPKGFPLATFHSHHPFSQFSSISFSLLRSIPLSPLSPITHVLVACVRSTATRAFLPRDSISIASISSFRVCTYVSSVENSSTTNLILIIAGPSPWCFSSTISFLALVYCRSNLRTTSIRASSPNIIRSLGFLPPLGYFLEFLQFHRLDLLLHRSIPPLPSSLEFSSIKPQPRVLRSSASFRCALMSRMPRGVQISQVSSSPRSVSYQVVFRA
ncbi:hypothetical protein LR48_Vigan11g047100 [Vigna angularis]|uniref:Uncharacterized protein n=1 Tax=Phaseolus angularis TaxID=3914 RepID=A0A0L9VR83_PHAAN|nr:hypothetical protein LR48_Vigan11g047100 [Vigna angularis]